MNIQTFTVVCGSTACDARCPFCISRMTPNCGANKVRQINGHRFRAAVELAKRCGVTTMLITGKGEPLLFPRQISMFLELLDASDFPLIELQTNGMSICYLAASEKEYLEDWLDMGLSLISVSVVHYLDERNREIYYPHRAAYPSLKNTIKILHEFGYSVRLSCMALQNYIDKPEEVRNLIDFAKTNKVEQLTIRNIVNPIRGGDAEVSQFVTNNRLTQLQEEDITNWIESEGYPLMRLPFGATVFDVNGQNVCWANCLTESEIGTNLRQLIFGADQHLRYSWQFEGAILL